MFNDLMKFEMQRTRRQAAGFYLTFLVLGLLVFSLSGVVYAFMFADPFATGRDNLKAGVEMSSFIVSFYSLAISLLVLIKKRLLRNFGLMLIALLSVVLGILPAAYLTTLKSNKEATA